jgi:hypothetical protein
MAQYAKVVNQIVVDVIEADAEFFKTFVDSSPGAWIQTDIFTYGGQSINGGTALRANYAGIGYIYDAINDVFYAPRPIDRNGVLCNSWIISAPAWLWIPPIDMPKIASKIGNAWVWDEPTKNWIAQQG